MIFSKSNPPSGFYHYLYLREDGTPYYSGKGSGKRAWSKDHNINLPIDSNRIIITHWELTEVWAYALERWYIRWYGRKDVGTGILRNRTDGGEGSSGTKWTDEQKSSITGVKNKRYGIPNTKISGENHPFKDGHNHGDKISLSMIDNCPWKGKKNPEHSKRMSGENNPNYNKKGQNHHSFGIPRPKKQCSRCGKLCAINVFTRYHEDNCQSILCI